MILAAGYGLRLRPLTLTRPKPLVPIVNRPLMGIIMDNLIEAGFQRLAVNTHHLADLIERFVEDRAPDFAETRLFYEPEILGAGGGIKNTEDYWEPEPALIMNGDILTDIDLDAVYRYHQSHDRPVTVALHDRPEFNQIAVNDQNEVTDFYARGKEPGRPLLAFTGIQVIDPAIPRRFPVGPSHSIEIYQRLAREERSVMAYVATGHVWEDIGSIERYMRLHEQILNGDGGWGGFFRSLSGRVAPGRDGFIDPGARIEGWACLGNHTVIRENTVIKNAILWDHVVIEPGSRVVNSVITDNVVVRGDVENKVLIGEE